MMRKEAITGQETGEPQTLKEVQKSKQRKQSKSTTERNDRPHIRQEHHEQRCQGVI